MQCKVKLHKSLTKLILHNILKMEKKSLVECSKLAKKRDRAKNFACGAVWWIACYSFSGAFGGGARSDPLCEHCVPLFGKLICT